MKTKDEKENYKSQLRAACNAIKKRMEKFSPDASPEIAIILGTSGPRAIIETLRGHLEIPYAELKLPETGINGHPGILHYGFMGTVPVVILEGRQHFYQGYSMDEITLMVRALGLFGIRKFILTNAAGSLNRNSYNPGDIVPIRDHVNNMGTNPLTGFYMEELGEPFVDMTNAYDDDWLFDLKIIATDKKIDIKEAAVYTAVSGPIFETPAEVRKYAKEADLIGMSTIPEVCAIRQFGGKVLALSLVTNLAAGLVKKVVSHDENVKVSEKEDERFSKLIFLFIEQFKKVVAY